MKKKLTTKKRLFAPCSHCADECANQPIQVLIVKPHLRPYGATICPSLRSMQDIVGGCIQVVHDGLLKDDAVIVCVVGTAGEDFTSLTPRQFADWTDRFLYCEQMIYFDDKIIAVPIADGSAEAEDEKYE